MTAAPANRLAMMSKVDPTETLTLRKSFQADVTRRMSRLIEAINETLIEKDMPFGVDGLTTQATARTDWSESSIQPPGPERPFDFPTSQQKIDGFMQWLNNQIRAGVLEGEIIEGDLAPIGNEPWTNVYIRSAYQKGIERSRRELNKRIEGVDFRTSEPAISGAFNQPFHAERVGVLYSRTFTELQNVTGNMAQNIRRTLAQGMAEGRNPRDVARDMNRAVRALGKSRAETIARTEIVRAHHQANIREMRQAGIEQVQVKAEWQTAEDARVCPQCQRLNGDVLSIDQIDRMIPLHPNCRCVALPIPVSRTDAE